jgi:integrase
VTRTKEQYEQWHIRDCARCGRRASKAANWEGAICRTCYDKALQIRGCCPVCSADRLLPGRRTDGVAICRDCAGITRDFYCNRCGAERHLHTGRLCTRCTLTDHLHQVLDDGTGRVHPPLVPLIEALVGTPRPKNGLNWLRSPQVRALLGDLASGQLLLSHEALQELPNWRTVAHLRDLLMTCGILPTVDKQLLHAQTWLHHRLTGLGTSPHHQLLRQFGLWHQIPRLRARVRTRPLTEAARRFAGEQSTQAERFLGWLDQRSRRLTDCTQADLDAWQAQAVGHHKNNLRAFLAWAISAQQMPKLTLPPVQIRAGERLTQARRLTLLRRLLTDERPPTRSRAAACLMLLYAQPASRIVRLTIDDIVHDRDQILLRLGEPPMPLPGPLASLILELAANRQNMNTAANPTCRWLFPGKRAGQPLHPKTLLALIHDLGVPAGATRTAALRQLVIQAPAPVVADALGYHNKHVTKVLADAGGTWKTYVPGDHSR